MQKKQILMLVLAALLFLAGLEVSSGTVTRLWRSAVVQQAVTTAADKAGVALDAGAQAVDGPAALRGKLNHADSPYFKQLDVFNMKTGGSLTVLSHFETYQQTTEYTCGPAAAYMVERYLTGKTPSHTELEIAEIMGTGRAMSSHPGTDVPGMMKYFEHLGWVVQSSKNSATPKDGSLFGKWVLNRLREGTPIMVENIDWGGHWRVIIGYDTMGTDDPQDDVLLVADPYDTTDHLQDGYGVVPAMRFYYMWFDAHLFKEGERDRLWVTARPKK